MAELDSQLPRKNGDILCNNFLVLSQLISPHIQMVGDGGRERSFSQVSEKKKLRQEDHQEF